MSLSVNDLFLENAENKVYGRQSRDIDYELYSLVLHLGAESTSNGHYVCYAREAAFGENDNETQWFQLDDSEVQPVEMEKELKAENVCRNSYILFYHLSQSQSDES